VHFLLADDQEDIRALTAYLLERNSHTVVHAASGTAALQEFQRQKFDIVLLDEEMPAMNGVQVLRTIRELQKDSGQRSLVIALTGNNTTEDCKRLLAAGFDAILGKPFSMETLNALIHAAPEHVAVGVAEPTVLEKRPLERVGGDEKLLRQMIRTFLRDSPKRMSAIAKALSRRDALALASFTHTLRGSLSIFITSETLELLNQIQLAAGDKDFAAAARHYSTFKEDIAKLEVNLRRYAKLPKVKPHTKKR
jgi:CheY-like chemotaxis protein